MPPRNVARTPRRRKIWAYEKSLMSTGFILQVGAKQVVANLLATLMADLSLTRPPVGITCMRIFGAIHPGNQLTASTNLLSGLGWGIAWVRNSVAVAGAGDPAIPDPLEQGVREVEWLQKGYLLYRTNNATALPASTTARMLDQGTMTLDITQMRKQPTADHQLVFITHHEGITGSDPAVWFNFNTMLALP